jgi:hypothetical protein
MCAAGMYIPRDAHACRRCPRGRYQSRTGMQDCKECPSNKYDPSSNGGGSECTTHKEPCSEGQYEAQAPTKTADRICAMCPPGRHAVDSGCKDCAPCPPGAFRTGCFSSNPGECHSCSVGQFQNSSSCQPCPPGQYQDLPQRTACRVCQKCDFGHRANCGVASAGYCILSQR